MVPLHNSAVVKCLLVVFSFSPQNKSMNFCPSLLTLLQFSALVAVHKSILQPLSISAGRSSAPVSGFIRSYRWSRNHFEVIISFVLLLTDFAVKLDYKTGGESPFFFLLSTVKNSIIKFFEMFPSSCTSLSQKNNAPLGLLAAYNKLMDVVQLGS